MLPLESCKLFSALSPDDLASLKGVTREAGFAGGAEIFKEGDAGDALYVVKSGRVQISAVMGGERQALARVPPGEVFGEMAIIDNQPRSATAMAEVETTLYVVPRQAMITMLTGSPQFSFSMMREITNRLREFNRQYIRQVLQAERMALVGRFASSIVHDLKNPLTIIGIAADMACEPETPVSARQVAQTRIRKQVDRISNMVSDILEFTRGGSAAQPALAMIEYAEFVRPVLDDIAREIAPKGVTIQIVTSVPLVKVPINPRRLSRVFYNLLFNAVDEMPEGGKIKMHFHVTPTELVTEIEDSGDGIAPQMLDKLFEAFETFGKPRGTGLGLSIAKKIVEEHRGRIYARNVPDGGALFGFTLPLQPAATA